MPNWDDFRFFLAVQKCGTMVAAAKILGTNVATVSRRVERLGEEIGLPLFIKVSGAWQLNPVVEPLVSLAEMFEGRLAHEQARLAGHSNAATQTRLKLGAPPFIGAEILAPELGTSHRNNPNIAIDLYDRPTGTSLNELDILVRGGPPEQGRLITRKVGTIDYRLYRHKDGAETGDWVGLTSDYDHIAPMIHARDIFQRDPVMRASQFQQLQKFIHATRMPAPLPVVLASRDDALLPLDPKLPAVRIEYWAAFHSSRKADCNIHQTLNWIAGCFKNATT